MGPTQGNFLNWCKRHMLIIRQPDKLLRDLTNNKGSTELSAISMWILVSGGNHSLLNIVFLLCMSQCMIKVRYTARSLLHCSPFKVTASLLPLQTLIAEATITLRPVIPLLNAAFRQSVPSQILFSITPSFVAY